ncbi:MAG: hypothetical protein AAFN74_05495, partial [Myxococcota bacterium]
DDRLDTDQQITADSVEPDHDSSQDALENVSLLMLRPASTDHAPFPLHTVLTVHAATASTEAPLLLPGLASEDIGQDLDHWEPPVDASLDHHPDIEISKVEKIATYIQQEVDAAAPETLRHAAESMLKLSSDLNDDHSPPQRENDDEGLLQLLSSNQTSFHTFEPSTPTTATDTDGQLDARRIIAEMKLRLNALQRENSPIRTLSIDLQNPGESVVRLTIQPAGGGQHRIAFFVAQTHLRNELRRALPQIREAASHLPVDVSDISIEKTMGLLEQDGFVQ